MAIYNEILSARFGKLSQKLFSMKGEQAVKQLSGELMMMQMLPFGVEHRYLLSENRFAATMNQLGNAAQFVGFRMRNPVGSGLIAVVEGLSLGVGTSQNVNAGITGPVTSDLGVSVFAERLDGRLQAPSSSDVNRSGLSLSFSISLVSAVVPSIFQVPVIASTAAQQLIATENQEITIAPGDALTLGNVNAATILIVNAIWRERSLEESELK